MLSPAMDRQGFVSNAGFEQLRGLTRTVVELIGVLDVQFTARKKKELAAEEPSRTRDSIRDAVAAVRKNDRITRVDAERIVASLEDIDRRVAASETAHEEALRGVELLSLLGVLVGFMTHEATMMLRGAEDMLAVWRAEQRRAPDARLSALIAQTEMAVERFQDHRSYAEMFIRGVRKPPSTTRFPALAQIERIRRLFSDLCIDAMNDGDARSPTGRELAGREVADVRVARCAEEGGHDGAGYYCILSDEPVCLEHSVPPGEWCPVGANRAHSEERPRCDWSVAQDVVAERQTGRRVLCRRCGRGSSGRPERRS